MADRRTRLYALLILIMVLVSSVLIIVFTGHSYSCDLVTERPQFGWSSSRTKHSLNNNALVSFSGYIEFVKHRHQPHEHHQRENRTNQRRNDKTTASYMPIEMNFVSLAELTRQQDSYELTIHGDCAELVFKLGTTGDRVTRVTSIVVALLDAQQLGRAECCIDRPLIEMPDDSYYSCNSSKVYSCEICRETMPTPAGKQQPGLTVALVLDRLALEVGGDPTSTHLDEFSKKMNPCKV